MRITIIVATDAANGIGIDNRLPWKLPEDLAFFKRNTSGHTVLMGRKTYESIGRPLPNRRNLVLSRAPDWQAPGVETVADLQQAIARAAAAGEDELFIIGGGQIYAQALPLAQRVLQTRIEHQFDCDAQFPPLAAQDWQQVSAERHYSEANGWHFTFTESLRAPAQVA